MKKLIFISLILLVTNIDAQRLGQFADEKPAMEFPSNSWGADLMFGEGGFGLGTFFRTSISNELTAFADISVSESKDDREIEYIDYFGRSVTLGKKNRVFLAPLNFGLHYRIFKNILTDNFRPYLNLGVGPTFVITSPYSEEFFNSLSSTTSYVAAGGYVGLGADFGLSKDNLLGLNIRYFYMHMFNNGVESMFGRSRKDIGQIYLSLNIGLMY